MMMVRSPKPKGTLTQRRKLALSAFIVGAAALLASTFSYPRKIEFDPERDLASDLELGGIKGVDEDQRVLSNSAIVDNYDTDQSVNIPSFYDNAGNVWDTRVEDDQPMMWYIPRAGGNTLSKVLTHCLNFVTANSVPGQLEGGLVPTTDIQVNTLSDGGRYINLDFSDMTHFDKAAEWNMDDLNYADVLTTQHIKEAAALFKPTHRGRIFAMLRHPVKRAVDMFYYRQRATYDRDFDGSVATMTLKEYALSSHHVENFMVRMLIDKPGFDVTPEDVETAKHILRRKVVVGIAEEKFYDLSVVRFERFFGWWEDYAVMTNMTVNHCHHKVISRGGHFGSHPRSKADSEEFKILTTRNWADMELYMYAKQLFKRQKNLIQPGQFSGNTQQQSNPAPAPAPEPEATAAPTPLPADDGCVGADPTKFNICLESSSTGTYAPGVGDWAADVTSAKLRWQTVITGDLPGTYDITSLPAEYNCGNAPANVDDLYVCAKDPNIDGEYGVLGSAGPVLAAYATTPLGTKVLPIAGRMSFDSADIERMLTGGTWAEVVTHEIGHILGLGSLWDKPAWGHDLVTDSAPFYWKAPGTSKACEKWREITGCTEGTADQCPPIENDGGAGTAGGHWEESIMGTELMSGWVGDGTSPLSVVTIGALEDMGYTVDYRAADPYSLDTCPATGNPVPGRRRLSLKVRALGGRGSKKTRMLSDAGAAAAFQYGNQQLDAAEAEKSRTEAAVGAANPDSNVLFVADEFVSVYYMEPGGDTVFQLDITRHEHNYA